MSRLFLWSFNPWLSQCNYSGFIFFILTNSIIRIIQISTTLKSRLYSYSQVACEQTRKTENIMGRQNNLSSFSVIEIINSVNKNKGIKRKCITIWVTTIDTVIVCLSNSWTSIGLNQTMATITNEKYLVTLSSLITYNNPKKISKLIMISL